MNRYLCELASKNAAIERDAQIIQEQKEEIQRLRDENNRLKGEQGKPNIRPGRKSKEVSKDKQGSKNKNKDISAEKEPHEIKFSTTSVMRSKRKRP